VLDNLESMPKVHRKATSERARTQRMKPQVFKTRRDVERYYSGDTIECLICGRHFKRLQRHLAAKHGLSADDYKKQFGLPWTRGLTHLSPSQAGRTNAKLRHESLPGRAGSLS
jgi:predicted transcriptional regulator